MSNCISFVGRLGRDAELKTVGSSQVCEFSLANETGYGDKKVSTWYNAKLWGKQGEALCQYLTKAKQVWISGELTPRPYTNKDGVEKLSLDVRVQAIDLVGSKSEGGESSAPASPRSTPAAGAPAQAAPAAPAEDMPF